MDNFIEHLLNSVYQHQRQKLSKVYGRIHKLASSYIKFGGWELSYNWKGRTRLTKELVGNIIIASKTIHFNINYAYGLSDLSVSDNYNLIDFLQNMAHELAHCILGDFNLSWAIEHDEKHKKTTKRIFSYLLTLPEVQELSRLQGIKNINKLKR